MSGTTLLDRAAIALTGPDARDLLQGMVTQDVTALAPGRPLWAGLLTPQGKALFDFVLWDGGNGTVLLDAERAQAEALARRLSVYRLRRKVEIAPAEIAVHWSPDTATAPPEAVPDPRLPALGARWLGPGGEAAGGWPAHRLSLGVTEGAGELGQDKTLWLECNAAELGGVSFAKGCYVGQENTARMHYRSSVSRRLVVAPLAKEGARTRTAYPALGLMVEHRRVDALGDAIIPDWLAPALGDRLGV